MILKYPILFVSILIILIIIVILFIRQSETEDSDQTLSLGKETGTVMDIDGNIYRTVLIGDTWWMADNLQVTRYRNDDLVPHLISNDEWETTTSGAYAIYPTDDYKVPYGNSQYNDHGEYTDLYQEIVSDYGFLYNWYAVKDSRGVCPENWRIPTETDWRKLEQYLGGYVIAQGLMKSTRTEPDAHPRWENPNEGATNKSGFSGLPGGYRFPDGSYDYKGFFGAWWSSSEYSASNAYFRDLGYVIIDAERIYSADKRYGFSVRCIKY